MFGVLDYLKMGAAGLAGMMLSVLFYEGVPLVKDIPYIGKIPLVGYAAVGNVQVRIDRAVTDATKDMVQEFRLTAALAQLDKERKDRETADQLRAAADSRAQAAATARDKAKADLEARIKADTSTDGAVWTEEDIQWQSRH